MCTEEEVGAPLDGGPEVPELARRRHLVAILDGAPAQEGDAERHRETELHVVSGVVVPARQVHLCTYIYAYGLWSSDDDDDELILASVLLGNSSRFIIVRA